MPSNFSIVNFRSGQRNDVQSFLVENDAFPELENMYLFRGRIERRSSFTPVGIDGRLKFMIGVTAASPFTTILLDGTFGTGIPIGSATFVIDNKIILQDPGGANPATLISTDPAYSGTLDRVTGALSITFPVIPPSIIIYIPGLPVMGLRVLEQMSINDEGLLAFDTRWSYFFNSGINDYESANRFANSVNIFIWTGTNSDLFWSTNYFKAFWATNNNAGFHAAENASPVVERDGIRWYGTISGNTGWSNFNPQLTVAPTYLTGGLIILAYKGRLLIFNTIEGATLATSIRFPQRLRWSQIGTPFYGQFPDGASAQVDAWRSDVVGKGGFIDAPTSEVIVSAEFIKDTIIVYFERSTWQIVYTGNEALPFVFQKINTELGSESTFSVVPFDRGVFAVGNYGIISCDSVNVERIDQKIPDAAFQIQNINEGVKRVTGIRDFNAQLVYFSYPLAVDQDGDSVNYNLTYPNNVLVFNYLDGSWAFFDDCFTCFGYWQKLNDNTWASLTRSWQSMQSAWNSAVLQARYPDVIAGNQRGFTMVFSQLQLVGQNSPSLPISNINIVNHSLYIPDHNLTIGQFVLITDVEGVLNINDLIYKIVNTTVDTIFVDPPPIPLPDWTGIYTGAGLVTHMPNIFVRTKEFNPFYENGQSLRLNYMDIYLDRSTRGQFEAQFYTSDNTSVPVDSQIVSTAPEPMPTYTLPSPDVNFQQNQNKIWHRIYTNSYGSFVQNIFTMNDAQMKNQDITTSDITIQGLIYYVNVDGRISYDI